MSFLKGIIIAILTFSFLLFIALFGALPAFRKTPISYLHRALWHHIPHFLKSIDHYATGGRITRYTVGTFNYLLYEKHPVVLIFFLALQLAGEIFLVPSILSTLSPIHYITIPIAISLPYYFLYRCATVSSAIPLATPNAHSHHGSSPSLTTQHDHSASDLSFGPIHAEAMHAFPYDYLLFHPGYFCTTCRAPKPPRSKHCSLCKACVQKADHHCIWINNCVGRANHVYFLLLVLSISVLLAYGIGLGYGFIDGLLQERLVGRLNRGAISGKYWRTGMTWARMWNSYGIALMLQPGVVAVTLLCCMCLPLSMGFLVYHGYLIWAGMTTNESSKWSDFKEDVGDGYVYRALLSEIRGEGSDSDGVVEDGETTGVKKPIRPPEIVVGDDFEPGEHVEDGLRRDGKEEGWLPVEIEPRPWEVNWPPMGAPRWLYNPLNVEVQSRHRPKYWYRTTRDGRPPTMKVKDGDGREKEVVDERWERVRSLKEVENVYDLGWRGGLWEVWSHR